MAEIAAVWGKIRWGEGGRTVNDSMEDYELCGPCTNDTNNCKQAYRR